MARTIRNAGFKIISQAFQVNDTLRFSARICINANSSSLVSIPIKYAIIPNFGMPKSTKASRTRSAMTFWTNVVDVLPRPFRILPIVVARYKNGQSQASVLIKAPAFSSLNTLMPRSFPKIVKTAMQRIPT